MAFPKIPVGTPGKDFPVCDLCAMAFPFFKFNLSFEVSIPGQEKPHVNVVVQCFNRNAEFRMIRKNHVG